MIRESVSTLYWKVGLHFTFAYYDKIYVYSIIMFMTYVPVLFRSFHFHLCNRCAWWVRL